MNNVIDFCAYKKRREEEEAAPDSAPLMSLETATALTGWVEAIFEKSGIEVEEDDGEEG